MGKDATGSSYEAAPRAASPGVTPLRPPGGSPAAAAARVRRRRYAFDLRGLAAFAIYFALAVLFFGRGLIGRFSTAYIGKGGDPVQFIWLLAWWPHALGHGLNPLYSTAVWAPHGVNLAWTMSTPLLNLVAIPLVLWLGPVAANNTLCLFALALAGWCGFILCRYATRAYWPAVAGGYVFGFSTYMVVHTAADVNLILVFPMPLLVLLLLRAARAEISQRRFVLELSLVLIVQFLLFVELFVTMTVFVGLAFLGLLAVGSYDDRKVALSLVPGVVFAYAITLVLVSPYVYYMFAVGYERGAVHPALLFSTDLLNLVVPTPMQELGTAPFFRAISTRFLGIFIEATGYIGVPLLLLVAAFAHRWWHEGWARLLVVFFAVSVVLSLGPFLLIGGNLHFPLPGAFFALMPLIGKALPARLMLYALLALALMTAIWLSAEGVAPGFRTLAAAIIAISILPNLSAKFWTNTFEVPRFFTPEFYPRYLKRDETVVALPYGINGPSMGWQLASGWYFRMAGGYTGNPPSAFRRWPAVRGFYRFDNVVLPGAGDQLRAFFGAHGVSAVLVDDREEDAWRPLLATLGVTPVRAGGITLYRIPPAELAPWKNATALDMETRADRARFAALVLAAEARIRSGSGLASLTPADVAKADALPAGWVVAPPKTQLPYGLNPPRHPPNPHLFAGMWLNARPDGCVEVGVVGWYPALRTVLDEYRAAAVDFTPRDLAEADRSASDDRRGMLVMTFTAEGLARAAVIAQTAVAGK